MHIRLKGLLLGSVLVAAGCDLDTVNPNQPPAETVLTSREGILAASIGLQARMGTAMPRYITSVGLLTDEMGAPRGALQSYTDAEIGELVDTYDPVQQPWFTHFRVIKSANDLILNAPNVQLGDSTRSGVMALAYLYKGMALGNLLQMYQQIPVDVHNSTQPVFVNRATALARTIALLDSARTQFEAVRPGNEFNTQVKASTLDLGNTIYAMLARYQRLAGNWNAALTAANQVSLTVLSRLPFAETPDQRNFIRTLVLSGYVRPLDSLKVGAEANDARVAFHLLTRADSSANNRPLDDFAQYQTFSAPIPLYYPGEVMLIKAEANTMLGQFVQAAGEVNAVRTKCNQAPTGDPEACLTALPLILLDSQAELLAEIYRQRRYELFATGLRWEDARRLGSVGTGQAADRCWLLYPNAERETNPGNTPANPAGVACT